MNKDHRGTIFIIDISGYSRFVAETENETGSMIVCALLESVIDANRLSFNISEIEGDAILFYRHGPAFPVKEILSQFEAMLRAFNNRLETFKESFPQTSALSIKLVVHYGVIGRFAVGSYAKLFGQAVVEAHRLLKNSIDTHTYALITKEYFNEQEQNDFRSPTEATEICELYDVGLLCYTYFAYPPNTATHQLYPQNFSVGQTGS
jgi:hypothetical protein